MKLKKSRIISGALLTAVLSAGLLVGTAAPANATVISAGGGTFDYGTHGPGDTTWAHYYHGSKLHRSTACNSNGCSRSADAGAGSWSRVSVPTTASGNASYWHTY